MLKYVILFSICILTFGCATTEEIDPADVKIAQLRGSTRTLEDRIAVLNQTQDDLQVQLEKMKQENMEMQTVLQENWSKLRGTLGSLKDSQRREIDKTVKSIMTSSINDQKELNAKLSKVVKAIQAQNSGLQQKVMEDLSISSQEVKSMRVQLNASMDKIERIEKQIKILNSAYPSSSGSVSKKSSGTTKKSSGTKRPKKEIKRTDKPTNAKIDYSQGYEHTVTTGETLWKIARDYKVSVQDILNTNPKINDETFLSPGQKLFIPYRKE
ncbi:LysM peptidoglycan-binding domain-containing protein [bacterium]|nr:LysM peptidoglycan-binding domain-containing protein [bacterium]